MFSRKESLNEPIDPLIPDGGSRRKDECRMSDSPEDFDAEDRFARSGRCDKVEMAVCAVGGE